MQRMRRQRSDDLRRLFGIDRHVFPLMLYRWLATRLPRAPVISRPVRQSPVSARRHLYDSSYIRVWFYNLAHAEKPLDDTMARPSASHFHRRSKGLAHARRFADRTFA